MKVPSKVLPFCRKYLLGREGLVGSQDSEGYTGSSVATDRVSLAEQIKAEEPD